MSDYLDPTPRQASKAQTARIIDEMRSKNPWALIDDQARRLAVADAQIDALRAEIVRIIGELDDAKKELANERSKHTSLR